MLIILIKLIFNLSLNPIYFTRFFKTLVILRNRETGYQQQKTQMKLTSLRFPISK